MYSLNFAISFSVGIRIKNYENFAPRMTNLKASSRNVDKFTEQLSSDLWYSCSQLSILVRILEVVDELCHL
jgi:hypothetical protein